MHRLRYLVGLLTLLGAVAGIWFFLDVMGGDDGERGFRIAVEFRDARGLRAGADVRYRGVTVGSVQRVQVSGDGGKAVAEIELQPAAAVHACVTSAFWIVTPRFSGLTTGATGLDTLVRDTYITFHTPPGDNTTLLPGSLIAGVERPPAALEPDSLEAVQHGDLLLSVLVPENHGIRAGAAVYFRGVATGDVRGVELAGDGSHVELRLRIGHRYRQTVTDATRFWVAQPFVSGALFSGFTLSDMSAILTPYLAYWTEPGKGVPVEDGWRTAAMATRPEYKLPEVPAAALQQLPKPPPPPADPVCLVHVVYAAVEVDTTSPDDPIRREGTGLLYLDRSGRPVVLTARSLCDGNYTETDVFGSDPEIAQEQLKVVVPNGPVLRAGRNWVQPDGRDLAILVLEDAPPDLATTPADRLRFEPLPADASGSLRATQDDGTARPLLPWPDPKPALDALRGAVLQQGDVLIGLLGQEGGHTPKPKLAGFADVPDDLRPQR